MAIREIKATLELDGEKKFNQTLNEASRNLRVMDSGLKAVEASYGVTGDRSQMLAKRSEVLGQELEQQKRIVSALSQALQEAEKKYGDTSGKTDGYRIKLNNALKKQAEFEKAIRDTEREMDELGRESISTGRDIERGIGDAAEDAAKSLRDMYDELKNDIGNISASTGFSAMADLGGGIIDTAQGLDAFAESSREYRRQMSFLERNAEAAGQDYETIKQLLFETAALTGDVDGAVEGISNLLAAGFDSTEMAGAIDLLSGAVIAFPDTLKFESLADSLQETIATRQATGQYAEALARLGVSTDTFNEAMAKAKNEEEAQQVALSFLANNGLKETRDAYAESNAQLLAASEASLKLEDAIAELGAVVDTYLAPMKATMAESIAGITDFLTKSDEVFGMTREAFIDETRKKTGGLVRGDDETGVIRTDVGDAFANIWNGITGKRNAEEAGEEAGKAYIDAATEAIVQGPGDGTNIFEAMNDRFAEIAGEQTRYEDFAAKARAEAEAARAESGGFFTSLWDEITGGGGADEENARQKGNGIVESVQEGIEEAEPAATGAAKTVGANVMTEMGNGINEAAPYAISATAGVVDGINAEFSRIVIPDVGSALTRSLYSRAVSTSGGNATAGGNGAGNGSTVVNMYMDTRKVGEAVIPTVSAGIGRQIDTAVSLG